MNRIDSASHYMDRALLQSKADVYTDLNSLQNLKNSEDKTEAVRQVAQQFESMFIHMMLKSMRSANSVFEEGSLFSSSETEFYRDMHDQQLSLSLAHGREGIGIADALFRQMTSQYEGLIDSQNATSNAEPQAAAPVTPSTSLPSRAQRAAIADSPEDFVNKVMPHIDKAAQALGVPGSFLAAQAALETGWGRAVLADEQGNSSFNIFNIKANSAWQGDKLQTQTLEFERGSLVQVKAEFRKYSSLSDAVADYVQFVKQNPRYQKAVEQTGDGSAYIRELAEAGYATDPEYAQKILNTHRRITTALAAAEKPVPDA